LRYVAASSIVMSGRWGSGTGRSKDAERRAGEALRALSEDEGLSVRETVECCGTGITVREVTRLRPGATGRTADEPAPAQCGRSPTRRIARGFRNFTNYRLRCLLAAGGHRPYRIKQTNHDA
jgi:hypothetical protein